MSDPVAVVEVSATDAAATAAARIEPSPQRQTSCTTALTECAASKFWTFAGLFLVLIIITSTNLGLDAAAGGKKAGNLTELALQHLLLDDGRDEKQVSSRFLNSLLTLRDQMERVGSVLRVSTTTTPLVVPDQHQSSLPRAGIPGPVSESDHRELSEG
jgi:hypothetical protein